MLNVAIVGLGWWGRHIASKLRGNRKLRVVAGVDVIPELTQEFTAEYGLFTTTNYQDVLDDPAIGGVILVTPHSTHEELALRAVKADKQIFCEKPLALTVASARKIVDACARQEIVLGLGHERRYERAMEKLAEMIRNRELGTILAVEGNYSHDKSRAFATDNWRGNPSDAPAAGWTGTGVHLTDLLISMLGPIRQVRAIADRRVLDLPNGDVVSTQFTFEDGTVGTINIVSATPFYGRLSIFGDRAWVDIHETSHAEAPGETHMYVGTPDGRRRHHVYKPRDTVRLNLEAWADAVAGKRAYRFTDSERVANVAVMEALVRSTTSGKPEKVRS